MRKAIGLMLGLLFWSPAIADPTDRLGADWPAYGRSAGGDRRSPLVDIDRQNVTRLQVVWRYRTGEGDRDHPGRRPARFSATPLAIAGRLYFATPYGKVIALDGATGRELWSRDFKVDQDIGFGDFLSRGVAWWTDRRAAPGATCASRIFAGVIDGRLVALDARTGAPCGDFGVNGVVNLREGLRNPPHEDSEYELTSPPAVIGDILVVGSAVADNNRLDAASGEVRGYDARSGRRLWTWDPVPQDPADPGYANWRGSEAHRTGAANTWSVIAADPARDLVFLPTSSPSPDYWGGARLGDNRYANSVVALRASTGKRVWSFQTVHHDLWDYDNAPPPLLVDLPVKGRTVPALLQATKTGQLFVLDRRNGRPIFPVEERAVPKSDAKGEVASPTQPFSAVAPLSPATITEADVRRASNDPAVVTACLNVFRRLRHEGPFTPPSERGTLALPSNIGGAHWGGLVYDPQTRSAIVPVNRIASVITLVPREAAEAARAADTVAGERLGLEYGRMSGSPYVLKREFFAAHGRLCTPTPIGALHAVSLRTGKTLWDVPLGSTDNVRGFSAEPGSGFVNLGGPILTASGLVFIGATPDRQLRAFDVRNGHELWSAQLPAGARSTPMTYRVGGKQFVVIAAGGDGEVFGRSDELVAFARP